ncbi:MAG: calcium-binding protein [Nannocystis sp.]|nr:calcium-binding protein [Nannocystis sp.]MBA3548834.1 calcium-binding protein [Nannocystis sp.]
MRIQSRLLAVVALLASPAFIACDKGDKSDSGETEAGTETDAAESTTGSATDATTVDVTGDPEAVCDAEHEGASRDCAEGMQFCFAKDGKHAWGGCVEDPVCIPGESTAEGCTTCELTSEGVPYIDDFECGGSSTPLVLSFGGEQVRYASAGHRFDLGPECAATDWPTAATPWLALDRDRSGAIDGGHELFGSATRLRTGGVADNGFAALKELDSDGDGRLTAADPGFAELVVWSDGDGDRRSTGFELQPVASFGLVAIELGYASASRCDVRGNCEVERAAFMFTDALGRARTGEVVDVHLGCQ